MKGKRISWMLAALVFFLSVPFSETRAETKELRVVGSWNNLTMYKNFEMPFWTEVIPTEVGLKTSMTSLSQVSLKGAAVLRQMKTGVFDVVHTVADYVVDDSPALAGLDLPALATDTVVARKVVEAYRPVLEEYLAKDFEAKLLSVAPYPAQVIFCRDRVSGLADLKGKKIRASGWTTSEFVNALGATGVTLSFSEVPQALQRGVVDCAVTGSLSGYSAGWGEVSKFVYPLPIGGWDYVIGTMSLTTWNSLTSEQQAKLRQLIKEKLEDPAWEVTKRETQEGLNCLSGGECPHGTPNKLELVPISDADRDLARKLLVDAVLPAWAEKVDDSVVKQWNSTIGEVVGFKATGAKAKR